MIDTVTTILNQTVELIQNSGPILGVLVIILESIIPMLPLAVFITLNILSFGTIFGFILSWLATVTGCMLSFFIARKLFNKKFNKWAKKNEQVKKLLKWMDNVKFSSLVLIVALPFTPAFAINIAGGISNISKRKYLSAMLVGKPFMVYFWAYIGANFKEMLQEPIILIRVILLMVVAYIFSKILSKKFNII